MAAIRMLMPMTARALKQLRAQNCDLRIASVHSDDFSFVIFLHPTEPTALACLAVDASAANPEWDYSAWD